ESDLIQPLGHANSALFGRHVWCFPFVLWELFHFSISDVLLSSRRIQIQKALQSRAVLDCEQLRIHGHAHDGVGPQGIERVYLLLAANTPSHDKLASGELAQALGRGDGEPLHQAYAVYMGVEKRSDIRLDLRNRLIWSELDLSFPAFYGDAPVFSVDAGHNTIHTDAGRKSSGKFSIDRTILTKQRRANDGSL